MPVYIFVCKECKHEFEELVRIDQRSIECQLCEGEAVRQIGAPQICIKGRWLKYNPNDNDDDLNEE